MNQDGQEIQDHYKKVARTLWPSNDVPDIDKIAVKFHELQDKAAEQDKEIQHWKDRADRAETMLEDIMHADQS